MIGWSYFAGVILMDYVTGEEMCIDVGSRCLRLDIK